MQVVEEIKEAYFENRKLGIIKSLHMTIDYYYQLVADRDVEEISGSSTVLISKKYLPFFGLDPVIHFDRQEREYWFEIESWSYLRGVAA